MEFDPYGNMPTLEDLKEAGATEWFSEDLAAQKKRNQQLKAALGGETAKLKDERNQLKDILENPPEAEDDEEAPPDLFAAERAKTAEQNAAISGLLGDLDKEKAAEKEMLKNLFGG